jgi:hypothetical protein
MDGSAVLFFSLKMELFIEDKGIDLRYLELIEADTAIYCRIIPKKYLSCCRRQNFNSES